MRYSTTNVTPFVLFLEQIIRQLISNKSILSISNDINEYLEYRIIRSPFFSNFYNLNAIKIDYNFFWSISQKKR